MALPGAIFVTKNPRRRKARKVRRKSAARRVVSRLKRNRSKSRGRKLRRRKNALALRTNSRRRARAHKRKNVKRRKNALALRTNSRRSHKRKHVKRRKNALALRTNSRRRSHKRKHVKRRKNALALRTNSRRKHVKRRKNAWKTAWSFSPLVGQGSIGGAINRRRKNSAGGKGLSLTMLTSPIQKIVGMVPVVGKPLAGAVPAVAFGAVAMGGTWATVNLLVPKVREFLPESIGEYADMAMEKTQPVQYTLGGMLFGAVIALIPSSLLSSKDKAVLAGTAVTTGVGVDAFRYLSGMGESASLSDGMLYELGADIPLDRVMSAYSDAHPGDANFSGPDLDVIEGQAAIQGARAWASRFPGVVTRSHVRQGSSRHAGRHGHRWGWLIRMVGFENFRKIAAMPAKKRAKYIAALSAQAVSMIPAYEAQRDAAESASQQAVQMVSSAPALETSEELLPLGAYLYAGSV